jgi:hypothetical protein
MIKQEFDRAKIASKQIPKWKRIALENARRVEVQLGYLERDASAAKRAAMRATARDARATECTYVCHLFWRIGLCAPHKLSDVHVNELGLWRRLLKRSRIFVLTRRA